MAAREMAAWASLLMTSVVWGPYAVFVVRQVDGGAPDSGAIMGAFIGAVVYSVVLSIVIAIILAAVTRGAVDAPADEREQLIALKAMDAAYAVLTVGVIAVAVCLPAVATGRLQLFPGYPASDTALVAANGVLVAVIVAELVRAGLQIARYRLGR